ncbi:DUF764 family protein (plasmid) [Borrelia puertoricensis]|nr:DUF764 family protein [Borrelia puertoricensis]UPA18359.1 DUF764 family protein [Borrelia puertoricensis]
MLIGLEVILMHIIKILNDFKEYAHAKSENICKVINTYNHPYLLSNITTSEPNIIAFKFTSEDGLLAHNSHYGTFYDNICEFNINFQIFIISLVINSNDYDAYNRMLTLYSLLKEFLHNRVNKYTVKDAHEPDYIKHLNIYIRPTSNMQNTGLITLGTKCSNTAYSSSTNFKAGIQIFERKE